MTDKETLYLHRLQEAEETLRDAEKMLVERLTPRSIINRAYYCMFYLTLALFIKAGINPKTSKHKGIISLFDREFVNNGRIERRYSKMLHDTFDERLEADYKELVAVSFEDAAKYVNEAREFFERIKTELAG
jgi:uncharacterized protein (UPF0332 family)